MRRGLLLSVLVALLLVVGWWFLLISPRNASIGDARDELQIAEEQEQRLRVQLNQLTEIDANAVLYADAITQMEALIPEQALLDEFIEQIDALAAATGVDLVTLSPAVPTPDPESELRVISVSVEIHGGFFDVLGFLFGLNDLERLVKATSIAVTSSATESGATELTVSLQLEAYTLADLVPLSEELPEAPESPETTSTTTGES
jgi:Tfp pilus assembly protein PilO